jgi:dTDP-4-dehydrorhamnose 3,5-epimerase
VIFNPLRLEGAFLIDSECHEDERGFLARTFCEREFAEHGAPMRIAQSSRIHSPRRETLRGLHYQHAPHAEVKLVRCTRGSIFLVMVDLRSGSRTRNEWLGAELTAGSGRLAYVPEGFAQGYQTLEDDTEVAYQMSHPYVPDAARGVRWDDPALEIDWPPADQRLISERDRAWPDLSSATATSSAASSRPAARFTTA